MLYAGNAGIFLKSEEGLANRRNIIVIVFEGAGYTVLEIIRGPCCY